MDPTIVDLHYEKPKPILTQKKKDIMLYKQNILLHVFLLPVALLLLWHSNYTIFLKVITILLSHIPQGQWRWMVSLSLSWLQQLRGGFLDILSLIKIQFHEAWHVIMRLFSWEFAISTWFLTLPITSDYRFVYVCMLALLCATAAKNFTNKRYLLTSISLICVIIQAVFTRYIEPYNHDLSYTITRRAWHWLGELILPALLVLYYFIDQDKYPIFMLVGLGFLFSATSSRSQMVSSGEIPRQNTLAVSPECAAQGSDYESCGGIHMDTYYLAEYTNRSQADIIHQYLMIAYGCRTAVGMAYTQSVIRKLVAYRKTIKNLRGGNET